MQTEYFYANEARRVRALDSDVHWVSCDYPRLHNHADYWEFWVMTDGKCLHTVNGSEYLMEKGQGILLRPQDAHFTLRAGEKPFSHICLGIHQTLVSRFLALISPGVEEQLLCGGLLTLSLSPAAYDRVILYTTSFITALQEGQDTSTVSHLFCAFILETVLSARQSPVMQYPQWICDLIYEINNPENLSKFTKDFIRSCNYSHQHVLRTFRRCTGKTLSAYINEVKLNAATEYLRKGASVLEVTNRLGFESQSYFTRLYKKQFGVTPTHAHLQ